MADAEADRPAILRENVQVEWHKALQPFISTNDALEFWRSLLTSGWLLLLAVTNLTHFKIDF